MMAGIGIPEIYSNNFMCPKYKNTTIRNDFMYTEMSQIIVSFKKCVNHSYCKTDYEIKDKLMDSTMMTIMYNAYYDHDDIHEPVKYVPDRRAVTSFVPDIQKEIQISIMKNTYQIHDSIVNPNQVKEGSFYSIDDINKDFSLLDQENVFLKVRFHMGTRHNIYEATVYSIFDLFSQLGGVFEIIELFGKLAIGYYVNAIFYYYVIKSMNMQNDPEIKTNASSLKETDKLTKSKTTHIHQSRSGKHMFSNRNLKRNFRRFEFEHSKVQNEADNLKSADKSVSFEHNNVIVSKSEANEAHSFSKFDLIYNML